ncbi:nucleotide sugar dehydrogenase [Microbacterium sp. PRC9]|uniref:nucleotide sugar dehydrogenase n=1 Tax=Microbacterium sp. PRC9 TaxID=2962591 RepID=UPI0028829E9F|nr:nucleotide sugar dehydrogenase [Microbacterium sp. PRC9]MDT0141480.1 nucleotide sugar dehydrogenase [Microbacterium sp. PRC9]
MLLSKSPEPRRYESSSLHSSVVIVGQGYVGLPIAMRAVDVGHSVVGVDLDRRRIAMLERGVSYVEDVPSDRLRAAAESGRYSAVADYSTVGSIDVAIITVPTPLANGMPDLSYIESAASSLAPLLRRGSTVILESTTYPGTTEEFLIPILERGSGLVCGDDFYVGYSPERIDPGNTEWDFVRTPKVVSGIDDQSLERVRSFYDTLVDRTVTVSGTREAELTKLLENTFRHVNIALINELAVFAHQLGVDVWEAIDAASTKPFGYMRFTPGPGVGGHCLPVDPSYLSWKVKDATGESFRFVELANDINDYMPRYVLERASKLRAGQSWAGSTVFVVGVAYKRGTGDVREAPAMRIIEELTGAGARILAVDPHVSEHDWPSGVERAELSPEDLAGAEIAIVLTAHDEVNLSPLRNWGGLVLDACGALRGVPSVVELW